MSLIRKLIQHGSTYMFGEVVIMLAGFISFPIFTRILDKEEYGTMSLITISLALVETFASAGLRHSSQRFYAEYEHEGQARAFYSTTVLSSLAFGMAATLGIVLITRILAWANLLADKTATIFSIAAILVVARVMAKIIGCIYRIKERPGTYALFAILSKYAAMGLAIYFVMVRLYGLLGYFAGLLAGELLVLLVLLLVMVKELGPPARPFSSPMLRRMIAYGFPLVVASFAGVLLASGDRYVIGLLRGPADVATYSVPYNLCSYIKDVLVTGMEFAFIPLIMNEWSRADRSRTREIVRHVIRLYCLVALPTVFGVCALGERFIVALASSKYAGASSILPYVVTGEMLHGLFAPLMIGLYFYQQTRQLALLTWLAAGANVVLNFALIPAFGLQGAALATLLSYVLLMVAGMSRAAKFFPVVLPWRYLVAYAACAALMYGFLAVLSALFPSLGLLALIAAGIGFYVLAASLADRDLGKLIRRPSALFSR